MEPVKKSEAPDYYEVIRFPIGEDPCTHLPSGAPDLLLCAESGTHHSGQPVIAPHLLKSCAFSLVTQT